MVQNENMGGVDEEGGWGKTFAPLIQSAVTTEITAYDEEGECLHHNQPKVYQSGGAVAEV